MWEVLFDLVLFWWGFLKFKCLKDLHNIFFLPLKLKLYFQKIPLGAINRDGRNAHSESWSCLRGLVLNYCHDPAHTHT